jgi:hypothetical protein
MTLLVWSSQVLCRSGRIHTPSSGHNHDPWRQMHHRSRRWELSKEKMERSVERKTVAWCLQQRGQCKSQLPSQSQPEALPKKAVCEIEAKAKEKFVVTLAGRKT